MNHYLHAKADDAAEAIENYISMHNLNPHDRIPSERAMAEEQKSLALTGPLAVRL